MKNKKIKYAQSRLRKNILTLSAFLLLSTVVLLDRTFHPFVKTSVPTQTADANDWDKYDGKSFIVVKVVDGDTIDINIPDANFPHTRIRLLGVDTPETKSPYTPVMYFGPEASQFTKDMVLGKNVTVIMDKLSKPRDKYHRLLGHIRLPDGRILNEELVLNGFAYADTRFPHSYYKKYIELEKQAKETKAGLWKKITIDQMPKWRKAENHVLGTPNGE
ncbi:MAG: thermonuclease family protein [Phycisphaerae bacterium]|jgi:endonuclease YncB( thermonuclease family)